MNLRKFLSRWTICEIGKKKYVLACKGGIFCLFGLDGHREAVSCSHPDFSCNFTANVTKEEEDFVIVKSSYGAFDMFQISDRKTDVILDIMVSARAPREMFDDAIYMLIAIKYIYISVGRNPKAKIQYNRPSRTVFVKRNSYQVYYGIVVVDKPEPDNETEELEKELKNLQLTLIGKERSDLWLPTEIA